MKTQQSSLKLLMEELKQLSNFSNCMCICVLHLHLHGLPCRCCRGLQHSLCLWYYTHNSAWWNKSITATPMSQKHHKQLQLIQILKMHKNKQDTLHLHITPTVQLVGASAVDQVFLLTVQCNSTLHCHHQGSEEDLSLQPADYPVLWARDGPAAELLLERSAADRSICEYSEICLYTITQTVRYNHLFFLAQ